MSDGTPPEAGPAFSAALLAELAASLDSRNAADFVRKWSPQEVASFQAEAFCGLRIKDKQRIVSSIEHFGGIPEGSDDNEDLLFLAAQDPSAWGFAEIYGSVAATDPLLRFEESQGLGEFLRRGIALPGDGRGSSGTLSVRNTIGYSRASFRPVGACLATDNPIALAWLLGDSDRFNALAATEPLGCFNGEAFTSNKEIRSLNLRDYHGRSWLVADAQDARLEKSLLFQAVAARAPRCAALLASIPEFSQAALDPERLRGGATVENSVFISETGWDGGRDQAARPQVSVFEEVIFKFKDSAEFSSPGFGPRGHAPLREWELLLERLVMASPSAAKKWRQSNGLGLPEIYFAVESASIVSQARAYSRRQPSAAAPAQERVMRQLAIFAAHGFDVQWEGMATQCERVPELAEWLRIQGAVVNASDGAGEPHPRRGAPRV